MLSHGYAVPTVVCCVLEAWIATFGERLLENARFGKMLVLEARIVTFGERLVESARFGSLDCHFSCMSRGKLIVTLRETGKCSFWKSHGVHCPARVSWQECQARESSKSVQQERQERVSSKSVRQGCSKSVQQECLAKFPARVSSKNVQQECPARVSFQECPAGV